MTVFESPALSEAGLNLQAVFDIADLPAGIADVLQSHCPNLSDFSQLLLIGHGGRRMWQAVNETNLKSDHPIDDYCRQTVQQFLDHEHPGGRSEFVYPGTTPVGLRELGVLAGWHHDSPFRVGVNAAWGPWFAYRAVVLTDTSYAPTKAPETSSPCLECVDKLCIKACPGDALVGSDLDLDKCLDHRMQEGSVCIDRCLSRMACPVGTEHRYDIGQISYHYGRSMDMISKWRSSD